MINETLNDKNWIKLFGKYEILKEIDSNGFFEIESKQINEFRESRLMAKFDHGVNLPEIFQRNQLSILPISRSKYIIGHFDSYKKIEYDKKLITNYFDFPQAIESIDYSNLYSESSALHCAYISGIISDLIEDEQALFTVSGRMSTGNFDFYIKNSKHNSKYPISVKNSQCEIDAGFESINNFLLIEAKNYSVDDFLIRQIYYPYRLWKTKISKTVIPIFMTFSNDIFSFFIYDFENIADYSSIKLIKQKNYAMSSEPICLEDIQEIHLKSKTKNECFDVPFPQADKFERVVDLLGLLFDKEYLSKEFITENYQFVDRQTDYYTNAGIYLGLIKKSEISETKEICYTLTDLGKNILEKKTKNKYLSLVECILKHEVFFLIMKKYFELSERPNKEEVIDIMKNCNINLNKESTTLPRRAKTALNWIDWCLHLIEN